MSMQNTSIRETVASAALLLVAVIVGVSLMPAGALGINLVYFAVPMAILCVVAHLTSTGPGWVMGSSVAFAAVAILETYWEQRIYSGPNSMPGFVYLFLCGPLSILGLSIACLVRKWLSNKGLRVAVSGAAVFFTGSFPVLSSLFGH